MLTKVIPIWSSKTNENFLRKLYITVFVFCSMFQWMYNDFINKPFTIFNANQNETRNFHQKTINFHQTTSMLLVAFLLQSDTFYSLKWISFIWIYLVNLNKTIIILHSITIPDAHAYRLYECIDGGVDLNKLHGHKDHRIQLTKSTKRKKIFVVMKFIHFERIYRCSKTHYGKGKMHKNGN